MPCNRDIFAAANRIDIVVKEKREEGLELDPPDSCYVYIVSLKNESSRLSPDRLIEKELGAV